MSRQLTFSQRLLILRREMGLSQSAFADKLRIGRSWMSQLEKGEEPSPMLKSLFERIELEWQQQHQPRGVREDPAVHVTGARARLRKAREAKGITPEEFAKSIGYSDPGIYRNIEEGRSQMGEKMARKAAKVLGIDVEELMSGSDHLVDRSPSGGTFGAIPDIILPKGMTAKFVPLLSLAECGPSMTWTDDGYAGEGVLAINCKDPKAFAVKLNGDSMSPKYDAGDTAIIYPSHTPCNGDVVLARLDDAHGGDVMIKLYQKSADTITLSSYNPVYQPMTYPRASFALIYPVAQITKNLR